MTTVGAATVERSDLRISVVLVAALTAVHLVMAFFVSSLPDAVFDLVDRVAGQELARLVVNVLPWVPLALVVLLWGRNRFVGWVACMVVSGFALLTYVRGTVVRRLIETGGADALETFDDWSGWALTMLLPVGAALGWGIARRRGTTWWPGLLVAATVAVVLRWLDLDAFRDDAALRAAFFALAYHAVPAVLAGLACWWLEARQAPA